MNKEIEIDLYHATNLECFNDILENGIKIYDFKRPLVCSGRANNKKKPGSLGYGFYCFSDKDFCENYAKSKIENNYKILYCKAKTSKKNILDLTDEIQLGYYNKFLKKYVTTSAYKIMSKIIKNDGYQSSLDGALLEIYLDVLKKNKNIIHCIIAMTVSQINNIKKSTVANGIEYCIKEKGIINIKEENYEN